MKTSAVLLRRRDFFDLWEIQGDTDELNEHRAKRLGLESYTDFNLLLRSATDQEYVEKKKQLVSGLHAIQGISPWFEIAGTS